MSRDTRKTKKTDEDAYTSKKFNSTSKSDSKFFDKSSSKKSDLRKSEDDYIKAGIKNKRERIKRKVDDISQTDNSGFRNSDSKPVGSFKKSSDFRGKSSREGIFSSPNPTFKTFKPKFGKENISEDEKGFKSKSENNFDKKTGVNKAGKSEFSSSYVKKSFKPKSNGPFFERNDSKSEYINKKRNRKGDAFLGDIEDFDAFDNETINYDDLRLNKFLAHCGIASRRKADELITQGKVTVNGEVVTAMGHRVSISDDIRFDGKKITPENKVYIILNKPKDFITTTSDEKNRKTVMDLVKPALSKIKGVKKPRLYPIGRLDRNTTGVLLITNDGELAQNLTHPSKKIRKVYHVFLDKKLSQSDFEKIAMGGVVLEDGIAEVDAIAFPNPKTKAEVGLEIHTGKNRFVRRLFESLGYEVVKLDRVSFAEFTKKDIPRGKFRFLSNEEIRNLKHFTN